MSNNNKIEKENKSENNIEVNSKQIIIYSLSLAAALGFNQLIKNIFAAFHLTDSQIIAETTYVIIMFTITLLVSNYLGSSIS
jgi:hypothetical protein